MSLFAYKKQINQSATSHLKNKIKNVFAHPYENLLISYGFKKKSAKHRKSIHP